MPIPKAEIRLVSANEASIEVGGKAIGKFTVALQEQETIAGVENAIILSGIVENFQDGFKQGFVFSEIKSTISATPEPNSITQKGV
jgi:hypothetical protein